MAGWGGQEVSWKPESQISDVLRVLIAAHRLCKLSGMSESLSLPDNLTLRQRAALSTILPFAREQIAETGSHVPTVVEIKFQGFGDRCYAKPKVHHVAELARTRDLLSKFIGTLIDQGADMIVLVTETDDANQSPFDLGLGSLPGHGTKLMVFAMSPEGEAFANATIDAQRTLGPWEVEVIPRTK